MSWSEPLLEADVASDPIAQFDRWFATARESGVELPEAAAVATATPDGAPSVRMVLVKQVDQGGFVFFTNYESRKGRELAANPRAALLFYWEPLGRQVRIEGDIARVSPEESAAYARSRPRGSRLSALASPQSQVVESRETLEQLVAEISARYEGSDPPLSEHWGGFRLTPHSVEFWQRRNDRLHDRLRYSRAGESWQLERLAP
jgi:pyridoxamine 5'-phosphate oxidase